MKTNYLRPRSALLVAALIWSQASAAQSSENKAAAEALFDQARAAMASGKYVEACAKFEQSQHLDPGIGTLLYLADCYEKSGRIASAWATFREGTSQARAAGQADRAAAGEKRAAALEPKLSKLTIKVAEAAQALAGLEVRRAGAAVAAGLWGVPVPVDGGEYRIEAAAPGHAPWSTTIRVAAERDNIALEIPALEPAAPVSPPPESRSPAARPAPRAVAPTRPPIHDAREPLEHHEGASAETPSQRTIGLVVGAVGIAGIGVGSYFGLRAISKNADAKELCDGATCRDPRGESLTNEAREAAAISNVAFGLGIAALGTGLVLVLSAPSEQPARAALRVFPELGPYSGGLRMGGVF